MGFSAGSLSKLDWDFRGIPREDGDGFCTGRGIVPEPSKARLKAFQAVFAEAAAQFAADDIDPDDPDARVEIDDEALDRTIDTLVLALGDLCLGSPSIEELTPLPPRAVIAFVRWLLGELAPKG